jgi:PAS domain S-box-containing protein
MSFMPSGSDGGDDAWIARALEHVGVGVFVVDHRAQEVELANDAAARIFGAGSGRAFVGTSILSVYPDPRERAEIQARLLANPKFRETGRARLQVRRLRQDTRELIDLWISLAATFDASGAVTRMECVVDEVGGERIDERAFRLSQQRFRVLFDTSRAGMVLTDLDGRVTQANPAFCAFVGCSADDLVGRDLYGLLDVEDRPERPSAAGDGGFALGERRFVRPDGSVRWGVVTGSWVRDEGPPHSAAVVIQDVTEKKKVEQSLQRIARLESLGLLAGGIAHDFNNVLAVIQASLAQVNRRAELDPETRDLLRDVGLAADRAAALARQLVTFAKGGTPTKRVEHLPALLHETATLCQLGASTRIDVEVDDDLRPCLVDPAQISQVFQNLFVNAIQAMLGGGRVTVVARNLDVTEGAGGDLPLPSGAYVCVTVRDEGVGIPPENLDRIFDPYFTTKSTGSGLGLATAHSIVTRHGGMLTAENAPERGSLFKVYLPATDEVPQPDVAEPSTPPRPPANTRVLLMDDEENLVKLTVHLLQDEGIDAEGVQDGTAALAAYRAARDAGRPFDVVVLDLTIRGGVGGEATFAELRKIDPAVRAIIISGYTDSHVMSEWRAHGFVAAVEKPFAPDALIAAIAAATSSAARR